jgi:hypothetical protein
MQLEFHSDRLVNEIPYRRIILDIAAETFSGSIASISNFARSYDVASDKLTEIVLDGPLVNYTWSAYEVLLEPVEVGEDDWGDPIYEYTGPEYTRLITTGAGISHLTNETLSRFVNPNPSITPLKVFYPDYYNSYYFYSPFIASSGNPYALTELVSYVYFRLGAATIGHPSSVLNIMERNGIGQPIVEIFGWKITAMHGDQRLSYVRKWGTNSLPTLPST